MGNVPASALPVVPNQAGVRGEGMQTFREIVSAVIALVILGLSVWMLGDTYRTGRVPFQSTKTDKAQHDEEVKADVEAYGRQKDLLLYALALLGTVTGYYLGRVPAEQRAQQAQQTAHTAQSQLSTANNAAINAASTAVQATKEAESAKRQRDAATATLTSVRTKASSVAAAKTLSGGGTLTAEQRSMLEIQKEIDDFFARG